MLNLASPRRVLTKLTARRRAIRAIVGSGLFDRTWYAEQAGIDPGHATVEHYLAVGEPSNVDPHPLFDVTWYRRTVRGSSRSQLGPFAHFLERGAQRGDLPHPLFEGDWYLRRHAEATQHRAGVLGHYLDTGSRQGTEPASWLEELASRRSTAAAPLEEPLAVAVAKRSRRLRREAGPAEEQSRTFERFDRGEEQRLLALVVEPWHRQGATPGPLVSIILPTHDRAVSVVRAIESVLNQTYPAWELIVVDDGSRDDTVERVQRFDDPRITLVELDHGGVCRARNAGLAQASGTHVAYLDSDNAWEPRFLEVMVAFLESKQVSAAHCALRFEEDGQVRYRGAKVDRTQLLLRNVVDCNTLLHRRELAQRIGGWDEDLRRTNDWDYTLRLSEVVDLHYVPFVGVDYEHDRRRSDRITVREPVGYRMKVRDKYLNDWSSESPEPSAGRVAVVIVAEAEPDLVEACVGSVLDSLPPQSGQVIVVDVSRSIEEALRIAAMEFLDDRVEVLRIEGEVHRVLPRNAGALRSVAETTIFLDAEYRVLPGWLEPLLAALNTGAAVAQPKVVAHSGEVISTGYLFPDRGLPHPAWQGSAEEAAWTERASNRRAATHQCFAIRTNTLRKHRGFEALYLSALFDADLCLRLEEAGDGPSRYVGESLVARQFVRRPRFGRGHGDNDQRVFEGRWGSRYDGDERAVIEAAGFDLDGHHPVDLAASFGVPVYAPAISSRGRRARSLRWAIKIAARDVFVRHTWGDWHFAQALARQLQELGHEVVIDTRDAWYRSTSHLDDVVLCLRGVRRYHPNPDHLNIMWMISHPEDVRPPECDLYDHVFVASEPYAKQLSERVSTPVEVLLQCTDPARFHPTAERQDGPEVLFVGNSRMILRPIVKDALAAGAPLEIVGESWDHLVPSGHVRATHVANEELPALYRSAGVVLNDHWADMRKHGFLSNRLFDLVACGVPVVSDEAPGLEGTFGGTVRTYAGSEELGAVIEDALASREIDGPERQVTAERIRREHSFAARAQRLSSVVEQFSDEVRVD